MIQLVPGASGLIVGVLVFGRWHQITGTWVSRLINWRRIDGPAKEYE